jgi:hypothetical protein
LRKGDIGDCDLELAVPCDDTITVGDLRLADNNIFTPIDLAGTSGDMVTTGDFNRFDGGAFACFAAGSFRLAIDKDALPPLIYIDNNTN